MSDSPFAFLRANHITCWQRPVAPSQGGFFVIQVIKLLVYQARFFTQEDHPDQVSPLPPALVIPAMCVGVLMTAFAPLI